MESPPGRWAPAGRAALVVARGLGAAGLAVGRGLRSAYLAVDPDVRRHVAQVPLLTYTLLTPRRAVVDPGEADGHPPLVFVHGLGGGRGDFLLMASYLWLHGRKRRYAIEFQAGRSIDEKAAALAELVRDVVQATGEPTVDIVAHSLGGVIVRLALAEHEIAPLVHAALMLGSPHQGTYPARYASTRTTLDLRPDSPLVQRLAAARWPSNVRGVSFWSRNDIVVLPPESAALAGTAQIEVTPFTHLSYLVDPRSWALVRRELSRE